MAKAPIIQQLASSFAAMHPGLRWVVEYENFYAVDKDYGYLRSLKDSQMEDLCAPYLEATFGDNSITQSTFDNFLMWLRKKVKQVPEINTKEIIFNDKWVLDLRTFQINPWRGQDVFYHIDCNHPEPDAKCPIFDKFLSEIFVTESDTFEADPELIKFAQEMFGYYLYDKMEPPVTFFLIGEGSNGKSTLLFVLEQLAGGEEFVMSNSIENLTSSGFDEQDLRFKRLNICGEEQSKYVKTDKFKAILDGSKIGAKVKFKDIVYFKPRTKHIFASNKMTLFDTIDYGMKRRFMIMPLNRRFLPHETNKTLKADTFQESVFAPELPAIVMWALEGARRLIANNYVFSGATAADEQMQNYEQAVSSVSAFTHENFEEFNEEWAEFFSVDRLYHLYVIWCKRNGKKAQASNNFREDLRRVMKTSPASKHDRVENRVYRGYKCIVKENSEIRKVIDYKEFTRFTEVYLPVPPLLSNGAEV